MSKAFDKVPHSHFLDKLSEDLDPFVLCWLGNYLRYRMQQVLVDGQISEPVEVVAGVPHGSVLGPILFLIYINVIVDVIEMDV